MRLKIILSIFILFLAVSFTFSQELSQMKVIGEGKIEESELIDNSVKDANGRVCAGLIIFTDLTGLAYQSYNGIVKINSLPGRDFLFLSPDERVVEIFKEGYAPLKIILYEYGIRLKSGQVWSLTISAEKIIGQGIPVNIETNVENPLIEINGKLIEGAPPFLIKPGKYQITIKKEGFKTITENIEINERKNLFKFTLSPIEPVLVEITSEPEGAIIFLNYAQRGETNRQFFLAPGKYKIKLIKSGFADIEQEIVVDENKENKFNFKLNSVFGKFFASVEPKDAELYLNKEKYKPNEILILTAGFYKIEIKAEGFKTKEDFINISVGDSIKKEYSLIPIIGSLQFTIQPTNAKAKLYRNDKLIATWTGSKYFKELIIGYYTIEASAEGFQTERISFALQEKENKIIENKLKKAIPQQTAQTSTFEERQNLRETKTQPSSSSTNSSSKKNEEEEEDYYYDYESQTYIFSKKYGNAISRIFYGSVSTSDFEGKSIAGFSIPLVFSIRASKHFIIDFNFTLSSIKQKLENENLNIINIGMGVGFRLYPFRFLYISMDGGFEGRNSDWKQTIIPYSSVDNISTFELYYGLGLGIEIPINDWGIEIGAKIISTTTSDYIGEEEAKVKLSDYGISYLGIKYNLY